MVELKPDTARRGRKQLSRYIFGRPIGQAYAIGNPSVCLSVTLVYCGQTA